MINAELFTDEVEKGFVMFADLWRDVIQDVMVSGDHMKRTVTFI